MSLTLMLSDDLVVDAHLCGELSGRTVAEQIEHWASLGKAVDGVMCPENVLAMKNSAGAKSLDECIREIDTPAGRQRLKEYLNSQPFPHYEGVSGRPHHYVRILADGTRTVGHFDGLQFVED